LPCSINNLQPKRGKTGPEGVEAFQPNFLLKLEKSFSFGFLEDPKYYCRHQTEEFKNHIQTDNEKNKQTSSSWNKEGSSLNTELIQEFHHMSLNIKNNHEEIKLSDITNSKLIIHREKEAGKGNLSELENRKPHIKKEGKENESQKDKNQEKIWLEKSLYNEPLQMQE